MNSRLSTVTYPSQFVATYTYLNLGYAYQVVSPDNTVSLGGRVLVPPSDLPTDYWRAVIADPTGASLGLVELEDPGTAKEKPQK